MSDKLKALLALAAEDLALAREPTTPPRPAAYHLSQAAEKLARAVCEDAAVAVGTTHNIGQIGALLPADHPMRDAIEGQNYHSAASTRYRYPDAAGRLPQPLPKEEIALRIDDVSEFQRQVLQYLASK